MGARVESLPISVGQPSKKWSWIVAGILALCMAAAASFVALQRVSDEASAPARPQVTRGEAIGSGPVQAITGTGNGLIEVANASAKAAPDVFGRGGRLAELNRRLAAYRSSGLITGTGPALAEMSGNSSKLGPSDTCRRVSHGRC
jgi:hypothetical protein